MTEGTYTNTLNTMFADLEGLFDLLCRAGSPTSSVGGVSTDGQLRPTDLLTDRAKSRSITWYLGQFPGEEEDEEEEEVEEESLIEDLDEAPLTTYRRLKISSVLWFYPTVSRGQAKEMLSGKDVGTFLVRNSTRVGNFALSVRLPEPSPAIENYLIEQTDLGLHVSPVERYFHDLEQLVAFYVDAASDGMPCALCLPQLIACQESEKALKAIVKRESERRALVSLRSFQQCEDEEDIEDATSPEEPARLASSAGEFRRSVTLTSPILFLKESQQRNQSEIQQLFSGKVGHYFDVDSSGYATTHGYDLNLIRPLPPLPPSFKRSHSMVSIQELRSNDDKQTKTKKPFLAAVLDLFKRRKTGTPTSLTPPQSRKKKKKKKKKPKKTISRPVLPTEFRARQPSPEEKRPVENEYAQISESSSESLIDSDIDIGPFVLPRPSPSPTSSPPPIPPRPRRESIANFADRRQLYASIDSADSGPVTPASSVFSEVSFPPPIPPRRRHSASEAPPIPPRRILPGRFPFRHRPLRFGHVPLTESLYVPPIEEIRRLRGLTSIDEGGLLSPNTYGKPRRASFDVLSFRDDAYDYGLRRARLSVGGHTYVTLNGSIVCGVLASDVSSLGSFEAESVGEWRSVSRSASYQRRSQSCDDLTRMGGNEHLLQSVLDDMSGPVREWLRSSSSCYEGYGNVEFADADADDEKEDEKEEDESSLETTNSATESDKEEEAEKVVDQSEKKGVEMEVPVIVEPVDDHAVDVGDDDATPDPRLHFKEDHFKEQDSLSLPINSGIHQEDISRPDMPDLQRSRNDTVAMMRESVMTTRVRVKSRRRGVRLEKEKQKGKPVTVNGQKRKTSQAGSRALYSAPKLLITREKTKKSPSRLIRMQLEKAAGNRNTKFGHNVDMFLRNHKDSSLEPQEFLTLIRSFMNQLKEYLLGEEDSELAGIVSRHQQHMKNVELDAVVEGALVHSILKPLHKSIQKCFTQFHKRTGAAQELSLSMQLALKKSPEELKIRDGLIPPQGPSLDHIRVHFHKMQATHSPLAKLEHLLAAVDIIYQSVKDANTEKAREDLVLGADDFLPIFIWVLVHCRFEQAELESEYLWGLLDPTLLSGEGGYYLTTLSGAVMVIKQISHDEKPRRFSRLPCISDLQGFLRVEVPDAFGTNPTFFKTFPIGSTMTARAACSLISEKLKIDNPREYSLFQIVNEKATALDFDACPQVLKIEWTLEDADETDSPSIQRYFSYRRIAETPV